MLKFFAILALVLGAVFGVPSLRAKVMPVVEPVLVKIGLGDRISNPIKKRKANNEIRVLLQKLAEDIAQKRKPPSALGFQPWVRANTRLEKRGKDPWDKPYWLLHTKNGLTVGSSGPDQTRDTPDDVKITVPYNHRL
jgi:hypothetical protein